MSGIDRDKLKNDPRYPFGIPNADNGNYLWIQIFYSTLNATGRAGFVMSNAAGDARSSEMNIRKELIEDHAVDVMVSVGSNMFFNVTLPCTLWFFDRGKKNTPRKDTILFIDIRSIYHQIDRAHRELTPEQIQYIARIARLYRGETVEDFGEYIDTQVRGMDARMVELKNTKEDKEERQALEDRKNIALKLKIQYNDLFGEGYRDIKGLCRVATTPEVRDQGYSLNAGRYVGVADGVEEDFDFEERMEELHEAFVGLTREAHTLEEGIMENMGLLFGREGI